MNLRKSIPWYFASTRMRFKEQRAIWRRRKNPGHFITRLFLKGRPGNEEAFNSTQNRISSPKVFHVLFYRRSIGLQDIYFSYSIGQFVPDLIEYTCMKTRKPRASILEKLRHCQRANTWWIWRVISIVA